MAFLPQNREPPPPILPSILSSGPERYRRHDSRPFSKSTAISIPGLQSQNTAPPPLPPPRYVPLPQTPAHSEDAKREFRDHGHAASPSTSAYGSMYSSMNDDRSGFKRRDTVGSINGDEGYASYTVAERCRDARPSGFLHHGKFHFQSAAELHGDSMKQKLNSPRTLERSSQSTTGSPAFGDQARQRYTRAPTLNMPVPLPVHGCSGLDSPGRLSVDVPIFSAVSPLSSGPFRHLPEQRTGDEASDLDHSPKYRSRRNNSDDASSCCGGYESAGAEDMEIDEAISPKRLYSQDACAAIGHKRRAGSPLADHVCGSSGDARRRDLSSLGSPTYRLTVMPQMSAASSMSSAAVSRSNSYISTMSMAPSSATTATTTASYGRRSSGANSPGGISPTSCNSPYTTTASANHSPRNSVSGRSHAHGRSMSAISPRKMADMQKPSGSKVQRVYMCECCPKKPKKFDTAEELSAHEAEKQYECSFCGNRFKNKNEAERHQNSLHVRRHSWSCSALSSYDRAFHDSTSRPGEADSCGYCGGEFPRSGRGPGSGAFSGGVVPHHATEQDWDERIRHLQEVHKFRECNSSKKFYRADHFRQHLKHSHAGTSGKWTNILENACMLEEEPSSRVREDHGSLAARTKQMLLDESPRHRARLNRLRDKSPLNISILAEVE